jgi:hypothetical protein
MPLVQRKSWPSSHEFAGASTPGDRAIGAASAAGAHNCLIAMPGSMTISSRSATHPFVHDPIRFHGHAHRAAAPLQGCSIVASSETSTLPSRHRASPSEQSMPFTEIALATPRPRTCSREQVGAQPTKRTSRSRVKRRRLRRSTETNGFTFGQRLPRWSQTDPRVARKAQLSMKLLSCLLRDG